MSLTSYRAAPPREAAWNPDQSRAASPLDAWIVFANETHFDSAASRVDSS